MTVYEKNLKTLAMHYPQMDVLIEDAKKELDQEEHIIEGLSYDERRIVKIRKGDKLYYLNGKRNTEEPAQMWVKGLGKLTKNAPIFMMGVGNYTYLEELIKYAKQRISIVIYEPSLQIFLNFLGQIELEKWMEKHLLIFFVDGIKGMEQKTMSAVVEPLLRYELLPFSRNLIVPNYDVIFPEQSLTFMKMIRNIAFHDRINYNTHKNFSGVLVRNVLSNLTHILDAYKTTQLTEVIPRDIPGIVVAAGPSLNKNIQDLKQAKGRSFIVAVDTAIKPLLDAGIVPDMFAIVDGEKPLSLIERDGAKEIPLVGTLCSAMEIFNYHTGMKFLFNEGFQYAERIFFKAKMPIGDVSTGGSVATNIFSLLYKIGLKRIILVGQDLALTGNKTHADGTFQEKMEELDTSGYLKVEGNCEEEVPTRRDFKMYLDWYDEYIEGCMKHEEGFRVINATEGGAKIKNTEIMTLKEAVEQECKKVVDIQECLRQLKPMLDDENRKWAEGVIRNIPEEFQELSNETKRVKKLYERLDKICDKRNIDRKEYLSILKKIRKAINKIEGKDAYQLVSFTLMDAKFILKNEQFIEEDTFQEEGKEIARKGILYMESVGKCARLFEEMMNDILKGKEDLWNLAVTSN